MYAAQPFFIAAIFGAAVLSATGLRSLTGSEMAFALPFVVLACAGVATLIRMQEASMSTRLALLTLVVSCVLLSGVHLTST